MNDQITRYVFAALCGVFFLAIGGAAMWEWNRFARRESALSARHLRWRMLSTAVWLLVLGSFAYASLVLWPHSAPGSLPYKEEARRFGIVTLGALSLMLIALALMAFDIFWTVQIGRRTAIKRAQKSKGTLQVELERAQKRAANRNGGSHGGNS